MFNWIRKLIGKDNQNIEETNYSFKWYEANDDENPFNKRILDIRSLTQTVIATTSDPAIAARFSATRNSDGKEFRNTEIQNSANIETTLVYPHNGESLEGIVFKAPEMEAKWDIYIYDNCFFFVRSWAGDLIYKAHAEILKDKIIINRIEYDGKNDSIYAINSIHFLMKTHAFGQVFPHYVTDVVNDEKTIALMSFSQFGNKACYACLDEILDATVFGK